MLFQCLGFYTILNYLNFRHWQQFFFTYSRFLRTSARIRCLHYFWSKRVNFHRIFKNLGVFWGAGRFQTQWQCLILSAMASFIVADNSNVRLSSKFSNIIKNKCVKVNIMNEYQPYVENNENWYDTITSNMFDTLSAHKLTNWSLKMHNSLAY